MSILGTGLRRTFSIALIVINSIFFLVIGLALRSIRGSSRGISKSLGSLFETPKGTNIR